MFSLVCVVVCGTNFCCVSQLNVAVVYYPSFMEHKIVTLDLEKCQD